MKFRILMLTALSVALAPCGLQAVDGTGIVSGVRQTLGTPYRWGGAEIKNGVDCSYYVSYLFGQAGLFLPGSPTSNQVDRLREQGCCVKDYGTSTFAIQSLRFGDLVYWLWPGGAGGHVWLYLGDGYLAHCNYPMGAEVTDLDNLRACFRDDIENIFVARPYPDLEGNADLAGAVEYLHRVSLVLNEKRQQIPPRIFAMAIKSTKMRLTTEELDAQSIWSNLALHQYYENCSNLQGGLEQRNRLFVTIYLAQRGYIPPSVMPEAKLQSARKTLSEIDLQLKNKAVQVKTRPDMYQLKFDAGIVKLAYQARTRSLRPGQLRKLAADELRLLRNSIYAIEGRSFNDPQLSAYFSAYIPGYGDNQGSGAALNRIETANIKLIKQLEAEKTKPVRLLSAGR